MNNRDHFYQLFWEHKSCYNLFLLSKEELLDTKRFTLVNRKIEIPFPRIIISNFQENDIDGYQIAIRNNKRTGKSEDLLQTQIEYYTPIVFQFITNHFGKTFERITTDLEDPSKFLKRVLKSMITKDSFEDIAIELLQYYGLAGKHITSFDQLEEYYKKEFVQKKVENALSDETIFDVLDFIRNMKELYLGELYRGMYSSNQVLVNILNSEDNFESRIRLFELLFEAELISYGSEDVFVECHHCDPGMYKGSLNVKLRPKKLKQLTCPICQKEATYFASFDIDPELFSIIKAKDGLLLDGLMYLLERHKVPCQANIVFDELKGLEIDCVFECQNTVFIIETKMFKLNTEPKKLGIKIKKSVRKLIEDTMTILEHHPIDKAIRSILVVNITNEDMLKELTSELTDQVEVMSLHSIKEMLEQ